MYHPELIQDIERIIGPKTASNFKEIVQGKNEIFDYELIGSLSITGFSLTKAKELMKQISLKDLLNKVKISDMAFIDEIPGFGSKLKEYIEVGLLDNMETIDNLMNILKIKNYQETLNIADKTFKFVITGELSRGRNEFKLLLEQRGHKVVGSVTSKTDYLITNSPSSGTVKNKKALELGKPIITEEEAYEMFLKE